MSGRFDVDTDAMRAHAGRVVGLSGEAGQAVSAADSVSFSPQMYGSIGAALVWPMMAPLQGAGVASTKLVKGALGDTADAVRGTADAFDFVENGVTEAMEHLKGLIP